MSYMDELVKNTDFNQNKPISEVVYENLRKVIISGAVPVGERIVEKEYAERLNVSRTPVRVALRLLEMEELVEYVPKVGVIVKRISIEDVGEIYKIRHSLEVLAATSAMENITLDEIEDIKNLLDRTEQKNDEGDVEEVIRLFGVFNSKIYEASRMKRLTGMISKMNEYLQRFRNISIAENERREKALKEHREILKAIIEKDKTNIDEIINRHLEYSLSIVLAEMSRNEIL
jgi:DNA-binding GntR family transcriptional regulator